MKIFNKFRLSDYLEQKKEELINKINNLTVANEHTVSNLLSSAKERIFELEKEIVNEPIQNNNGSYKISIIFPFKANSFLLDCFPSTSTICYLDETVDKVTINSSDITIETIVTQLDVSQLKFKINDIKSKILINVPRLNEEIEIYNNSLEYLIKQRLEEKAKSNTEKDDFMQEMKS